MLKSYKLLTISHIHLTLFLTNIKSDFNKKLK